MKFLYLLFSLCFALPSNSLSIILPLYLYPGADGTAWNDVFSTIEANPAAQWQVVINPNSGPGTTGVPSAEFISVIAKLNIYPNVNTVGYVATSYGDDKKGIAAVNAETDVYASWASYGGANIAIGGIYFDEVSSDVSKLPFYQTVADHARSSFKSSAHVVFNPGYRAPTQLFSYADTIVEFEDSLAAYQSQGIIDQIPAQFRGQSALQIKSTPEGTDVASLMSTMAQSGIEAVYFGVDDVYKIYSKTLLQGMAQNV